MVFLCSIFVCTFAFNTKWKDNIQLSVLNDFKAFQRPLEHLESCGFTDFLWRIGLDISRDDYCCLCHICHLSTSIICISITFVPVGPVMRWCLLLDMKSSLLKKLYELLFSR